MSARPLALLLACALAACTRTDVPADAAATPATPVPAPAPAAPAPPVDETGPFAFDGVAGVAFGSPPSAIEQAWSGGVIAATGEVQGACHYLYATPKPGDHYGVAFMFEDERFVRVDVDTPGLRAPGGGHAGMTADAVRALYAGVEEQPHKYVEDGKYLVVPAPGGGATRLVFEVDAAGTVSEWRLGLPPQVHYVEGCS